MSMPKDEYRAIQREESADASPNGKGCYGCYCCRRIYNLNDFKKWARKLARRVLAQKDQKAIVKGNYEDM